MQISKRNHFFGGYDIFTSGVPQSYEGHPKRKFTREFTLRHFIFPSSPHDDRDIFLSVRLSFFLC